MTTTAPDAYVLTHHAPLSDTARRLLPPGSLVTTHRARSGRVPPWSGLTCGPVPDGGSAAGILDRLRAEVPDVVRGATGRVQPGLDLWRPRGRPHRTVGIVEYLTTVPDQRADYYATQVDVSGPAMREQWEAGLVQRFVGIEVVETVVGADTPGNDWDLVHLTQIPVRAFPRMLRWSARFDERARAAGYPDMATVRRTWKTQRSMVKTRGTIRDVT